MTAKQSLECFPYSVKGNLQKLELLLVTKHWLTISKQLKDCRNPVVAKRTINVKKANFYILGYLEKNPYNYARIFFSKNQLTRQVAATCNLLFFIILKNSNMLYSKLNYLYVSILTFFLFSIVRLWPLDNSGVHT